MGGEEMRYAQMLRKGIEKKGYSLTQLSFRLAKKEIWLEKTILSKMQTGKYPPAKDEVNIVLAEILDLDPVEFRVAAVKEMLPESLIKLIKTAG
jgi:ribosome-binding protein aMBF1 (putative translation factor)